MTSVHTQHESLSALFDGELPGDAGRFARRRLEHDPDWQGRIERWQLIGDVMRGQASTLAPAGFAERVAAAIAVPHAGAGVVSTAVVASPSHAAPRRARLWSGMALAASVAAVAALVMPSMRDVAPPAAPVAATPAAAPVIAPSMPSIASSASVDGPRIATPVRSPMQRTRATGTRIARAQPSRPSIRPSASPPARVAVRPFQPPVDDTITTRPWPRATLPGLQAGGAFTAGYNGTREDGPSFYPFEPDAHADVATPSP